MLVLARKFFPGGQNFKYDSFLTPQNYSHSEKFPQATMLHRWHMPRLAFSTRSTQTLSKTKQMILSASLTAFLSGNCNFIADFLEERLGEAYGWTLVIN